MHRQQQPVRPASLADAPLLADILADAFAEDPLLTWLIPHTERRRRNLPTYFLTVARRLYLPHREVFLTENHSGAAMWLPPGVSADVSTLSMCGLLWRLFLAAGFAGLRRADAIRSTFAANHPTTPHYYLHALGVRRANQGQGVGSALLRHMAERLDRERIPAYLENSNERNLPLYERHGFRVVGEWRAPGGPPIWFMLRTPRDHASKK